jgi:hypothetical protein
VQRHRERVEPVDLGVVVGRSPRQRLPPAVSSRRRRGPARRAARCRRARACLLDVLAEPHRREVERVPWPWSMIVRPCSSSSSSATSPPPWLRSKTMTMSGQRSRIASRISPTSRVRRRLPSRGDSRITRRRRGPCPSGRLPDRDDRGGVPLRRAVEADEDLDALALGDLQAAAALRRGAPPLAAVDRGEPGGDPLVRVLAEEHPAADAVSDAPDARSVLTVIHSAGFARLTCSRNSSSASASSSSGRRRDVSGTAQMCATVSPSASTRGCSTRRGAGRARRSRRPSRRGPAPRAGRAGSCGSCRRW